MYVMNSPDFKAVAGLLGQLPQTVLDTRKALGLSLRAAAEQIGVSFSQLYQYEKGGRGANTDSLQKMLLWLDEKSPEAMSRAYLAHAQAQDRVARLRQQFETPDISR